MLGKHFSCCRATENAISFAWNSSDFLFTLVISDTYPWCKSWPKCCFFKKPSLISQTMLGEPFNICPSVLSRLVVSDSCNPSDCSLPGFFVHGIFQARLLEWFAISFFRGSFQPRHWIHVFCISRRILCHWAKGSPYTPISPFFPHCSNQDFPEK